MVMTMDRIRGMKRDIEVTEITEGVEAGTVEERETMGHQELIISTTEEGETAGKGEAPEKSARRP